MYLVNQSIIFRFPRRKTAAPLLARENKLLKTIAPMLDLEIPVPIYIGGPSADYAYSFHGYCMLKGVSASHAQLSIEQRVASVKPLAMFLKQLHQIKQPQALAMGAEPQLFDRTQNTKLVHDLQQRSDKIVEQGIASIEPTILQQELQAAIDIHLPEQQNVLVHGDLYSRHLMFDRGILCGVIDWGDIGVNSPAVDLAVIFSFYPPSCRKNFLEIYGELPAETWQYARFLGLYSTLAVLLYAGDIADELLQAEATMAIDWINPQLLVH